MSCEYCYLPNKYHDGKHWKTKTDGCGCISHGDDGRALIAVWKDTEPARSLVLIYDVKYCPFCGDVIKVPDTISMRRKAK